MTLVGKVADGRVVVGYDPDADRVVLEMTAFATESYTFTAEQARRLGELLTDAGRLLQVRGRQ